MSLFLHIAQVFHFLNCYRYESILNVKIETYFSKIVQNSVRCIAKIYFNLNTLAQEQVNSIWELCCQGLHDNKVRQRDWGQVNWKINAVIPLEDETCPFSTCLDWFD